MRNMRKQTYRTLQIMAAALCAVSTLTFAQTSPRLTLAGALLGVGVGDWLVTAVVALSFGLVSLLQRFKAAEAGDRYLLFVAAHMSGSLISGVIVYLLVQGTMDEPNRFMQALAIGAAGWSGSKVADAIAERINRATTKESTP